jgi:alpha-amylase/alpha-mannosidase (GH57 family)
MALERHDLQALPRELERGNCARRAAPDDSDVPLAIQHGRRRDLPAIHACALQRDTILTPMPARKKSIAIHGHFYQPPRENPWLEAVETQDSAFPFHDWNARITDECYEPNATARILDAKDRILGIVNNYASISFNFGATLLSWLETCAPDTYAAILEADRVSLERYSGHGCAIAQGYNHIILPLANHRDKRTQVRWGIRDFEHRFGRKPEAMWLPETAVDVASLEALAAEELRYTILEPHQAARWRRIGDSNWTHGSIDPTMPYVCRLPSGKSIAIFFYDGPISRAVAFEQLLARGENFAHRVLGALSDARTHAQLVNIATDGETYGHHHRFGEMALAYALQMIEARPDVRITNHGEFLERHPPAHEVEIVENTAWSCAHGVERWRSDCGCNAGAGHGWNQRWRTPLRDALDWLRDEVSVLFEREGARVLRDPWAAREDYIDVILERDEPTLSRFLSKHAAGGAQVSTVLELMEMQRNAMLMYTSCGWFFSDVSGIETVQVMHYAARVIQLAERVAGTELEAQFLERLAHARSNIHEKGTARQIYEREVAAARLGLERVAAHYAVLSLFDSFDEEARVYCYDVVRRDLVLRRAGRARLAVGVIDVRSRITHETATFELAALHLGETELTGGVRMSSPHSDYGEVSDALIAAMEPGGIPTVIRLLDEHFHETTLSIRSLFRDEQRRILHKLIETTLQEAESAFRQLHERYDPLMRFHTRLGVPVPQVLRTAAEFDLNLQMRRLLDTEPPQILDIEAQLREAREEKVTLDTTTTMAFEAAIERASAAFRERPDDLDRLEALETLVMIVRDAELSVDLRRAQNRYYRMRASVRPAIAASGNGIRWLALFDALGEKLTIAQ